MLIWFARNVKNLYVLLAQSMSMQVMVASPGLVTCRKRKTKRTVLLEDLQRKECKSVI
jgi:hypothetical protein